MMRWQHGISIIPVSHQTNKQQSHTPTIRNSSQQHNHRFPRTYYITSEVRLFTCSWWDARLLWVDFSVDRSRQVTATAADWTQISVKRATWCRRKNAHQQRGNCFERWKEITVERQS